MNVYIHVYILQDILLLLKFNSYLRSFIGVGEGDIENT
jgi:hypothetical protein